MKQNKVTFFDVDGTLISGQSQIHFINFLRSKNVLSVLDYLKIYLWYIKYVFFSGAIVKDLNEAIYTKVLSGKTVEELNGIVRGFMKRESKNIRKGATKIIKERSEEGEVYLISSMPQPLLDGYGNYFGVKKSIGTRLEIVNNCYTGKIVGNILVGKEKLDEIQKIERDGNFAFFTDHENDLKVLENASEPVVVCPTSKLLKIAKNNKWRVISL
jgi:HAD superfamily hydrolase (TIGR01490 family)